MARYNHDLLHRTDLEGFKNWAWGQRITIGRYVGTIEVVAHLPSAYEVLRLIQVCREGENGPYIFYQKSHDRGRYDPEGATHISVPSEMLPLVRRYIKWKKSTETRSLP